jgi:hypothetical protein
LLELTAYSDESVTDGAVFCMAGYLAAASEWEAFDLPWNEALEAEALGELKMSLCEGQPQRQARFIERRGLLIGVFGLSKVLVRG